MSRGWISFGMLLFGCVALATVLWMTFRGESAPEKANPPRQRSALQNIGRGESEAARTPGRSSDDMIDACPIRFRDVSAESGIAFLHTDGSGGQRYIVESMSAGLVSFDYDNDGLVDLYFPNGAPLPGTVVEKQPRHALYKNLGNCRFRETTDEAGLGSTAYGMGAAAADYDNDGDMDLYVSNFGPNILYRNNGDGTFDNVTEKAGVARADGGQTNTVGAGICFLDVNNDGWLDLYVGNYMELVCSRHVPHRVRKFPTYPSPAEYDPLPDTLYLNQRDGTFRDVSRESGIAAHAGRSMGMIATDFDDDGDVDVFVCNDVQENFLFRNDGTGRFEEVGLFAGVALNSDGKVLANMGPDCADYNHDGRLDIFTTNYQGQLPMLLQNLGDGAFEDVALQANSGVSCFSHVNWGCGMVDLDNDGFHDIFIANGHTEDNIEIRDPTAVYRTHNTVLWHIPGGTFLDVSARCGVRETPVHAARGVVFEDFDNDGDLDAVVLNSRERPTVLKNLLNEHDSANHWLHVRLRGVHANRGGVGARVTITAGDLVLVDEMHSGRGYQSHWGSRLHFGLGRRSLVDQVEIRWPGGTRDVFHDLPSDTDITLTEGTGDERPR